LERGGHLHVVGEVVIYIHVAVNPPSTDQCGQNSDQLLLVGACSEACTKNVIQDCIVIIQSCIHAV